jgi:hypothetical protein
MSENTITIEGKNGIVLIEGIDYILNMKKGSITITGEGFSKFPAIIMVPYKSESHHKRKGNHPHCKDTGNINEMINIDDTNHILSYFLPVVIENRDNQKT